MSEQELTLKLIELAEVPAPPITVDVERARRDGKRRRRLRTYAVIAGCVTAVVAGGVAAVSVPGAPAPENRVAGPAPAPALPPVDPAVHPLVAKAGFGWLPDGIFGVEYRVGEYGTSSLAIGRGENAAMIWLTVYDQEPPLDRNKQVGPGATRVPVRVAGRDGYWVSRSGADPLNGGDSFLRWPVGDGRWLDVHAYSLDVRDPEQVLLRVAEGVTVGDRPVPVPVRISSLPENFELADATLARRPDRGGGPWELDLRYSVNGANVHLKVTTIGGRPPKADDPVCTEDKGLVACVTVDRPVAADLGAIGGAEGLLDRLTLLGPDESAWSTRMIG
ncbi:hypothetical protein [Amycolatopsis magusensis]|uniref:hypothetical protein n=1 Tax=Amycolatopsis magusensis TaxID=882444 RepID=UPI003C2EC9F5